MLYGIFQSKAFYKIYSCPFITKSHQFIFFLLHSEGREGADDKKKWKQMQVLMNDSVKFVEMLYNVDWENGLPQSTMTNLEYFLPKKEGEGVTGEGSLLELPGVCTTSLIHSLITSEFFIRMQAVCTF